MEKELDHLLALIEQNESVLAFQRSEEKIMQIPELKDRVSQMKAYQQDAVLFDKLDKPNAFAERNQQVQEISDDLEQLPIVQDYREKMQDASDLLQFVTNSIQEKINQRIG